MICLSVAAFFSLRCLCENIRSLGQSSVDVLYYHSDQGESYTISLKNSLALHCHGNMNGCEARLELNSTEYLKIAV